MTDNKAESTQLVADADKVPIPKRIAYALGGPVDILSVWVLVSIAYPVFNMYLKMPPTYVAIIIMSLRLWDAISDPIMGWISDNTRTRWGRRRPYILIGAIMAGLTYPLIWWFPDGMQTWQIMLWVIGFGILFYTGFTIWAMPYQSLLMEMTPDYNERTRVAAFRGYMQTLAGLFVGFSWLLILLPVWVYDGPLTDGMRLSYEVVKSTVLNTDAPAYPSNVMAGIRYLSFGIGAVIMILGVIPAFFVKERYYEHNLTGKQKKVGLIKSFKETLSNKQFMVLCTFTIFFLLGTSIWDSYGRYVGTYYVLGGDWMRSSLFGVYGTIIYTVVSLLLIPFFKWLSEHIGKTKCLFIASILVFFSAASTWFTYNPDHIYVMLLNTFLIGAGYAGLWLMIPSMQADVIDLDELNTGERREGSYSAVFSWVLKLSFCAGYLLSGPLLEMTGFDAGEFDSNKKTNNALPIIESSITALPKEKAEIIKKFSTSLNETMYSDAEKSIVTLNKIDEIVEPFVKPDEKDNKANSIKAAVDDLKSVIIPGYNNLQMISWKVEDLRKRFAENGDKGVIALPILSQIEKQNQKIKNSIMLEDPSKTLEQLTGLSKTFKQVKAFESNEKSITGPIEEIDKSILAMTKFMAPEDEKQKAVTIADLKPVVSNDTISGMLKNMRIGYLALPVAALLIALFVLKFYNINKKRADEIRAQLEARRGKV
jgi:GPH family glycoside/pentoside/hexuronide:cation symporter